jgi:hypothetical protein
MSAISSIFSQFLLFSSSSFLSDSGTHIQTDARLTAKRDEAEEKEGRKEIQLPLSIVACYPHLWDHFHDIAACVWIFACLRREYGKELKKGRCRTEKNEEKGRRRT